jgi:diguanylate cyclase (GGDEF)-like protein/PAS domain S-box-containing protein
MSIIVYSSLLIYMGVAFYDYIGPAIWCMATAYLVMSLLHARRDMLIGFATATAVLLVYVLRFKPPFTTDWVYDMGLIITLVVLVILIAVIHYIINERLGFMKRQYDALYRTENQFYFTLNAIGDGVITTDANGMITFMNPVAVQLSGWRMDEVIGKPFREKIVLESELTHETLESPVDLVISSQKILHLANHTMMLTKNGDKIVIEDTASPIFDESGKLSGVVLVVRDHRYKQEKQREIEYLSYHDQLSGLYNRRYFEEILRKLDKETAWPLAILFIDVNGLKIVNDAFGHSAGDELITKVAHVLSRYKRSDDVIARIGGDEFVIIMPRTEQLFINHYTKQVTQALRHEYIMGIEISVSFGWEVKKKADQDVFECLKHAEDRMYQSKIYYGSSKRNDIIKSISSALAMKSTCEEAHAKRVGELCASLGRELGFSEGECQKLKVAGELHDIGKIAIDESLLNKTGALTLNDWNQIKQHPETGYRLLNTSKEFYGIAEYVRAHHEFWDGKGYPSGLKGLEIPLNARIIAIADAFDAMTNDRAFRKAMTTEEAVNELLRCAGTQFDPELTRVFIEKVC